MELQRAVAMFPGQALARCDSHAGALELICRVLIRGRLEGAEGCRPGPPTTTWRGDLDQALHLAGPQLLPVTADSLLSHGSLYQWRSRQGEPPGSASMSSLL